LESLGAKIPEAPKSTPAHETEEPKVQKHAPEPKPTQPTPPPTPEPEVKAEPDNDLWTLDEKVELPMGNANKMATEDEEGQANDLYSQGRKAFREKNLEAALKIYSDAIEKNPQSAVLFAARGEVSLTMKKPNAAISDANKSLALNPDSAKAYKVRGTARRHLGQYEDGLKDLYQGNKLDWDETTDTLVKSIKSRVDKIVEVRRKDEQAAKEKEMEDRKRKAADLRRQQQEDEDKRRRQEEGMEGMGGMGGMGGGMGGGGMGGMPADFMNVLNDPDIQAAMKDPAVIKQVQECASDPAKLEQYARTNPKLKKIVEKLGPLMSMFAGAGGAGGGADDAGEDAMPTDDLD